jgi:cell division protein FtsX
MFNKFLSIVRVWRVERVKQFIKNPWITFVSLLVLVSVLLLIFFLNDFVWQLQDMGEDLQQPQNYANLDASGCEISSEVVRDTVKRNRN